MEGGYECEGAGMSAKARVDVDGSTPGDQRHAAPVEVNGTGRLIHPNTIPEEGRSHDVLIFAKAAGIRLWDVDGKEYIDGLSGLCNVNVGYGRRELARVAVQNLEDLSFGTLFWARGSTQAAELADKLADITPAGIERFFFTCGGSEAVETAIKLVRYANCANGRHDRIKIIGRHSSYHGVSLGALSATGAEAYREDFGPLVPGFIHIGQPWHADAAQELEECILKEGPETVAAFIAEPASLPAGLCVPSPTYWPDIRAICDKYDVALILDEVVTGFGRTGEMFASDHWGLSPDLIVMAKGITSGYLPLGAVGLQESFYRSIARLKKPLMHGFTAGGHPACCAVALKNIEIIESERLVERAASMGELLKGSLEDIAERCDLGEVRGMGLLCVLDLARRDRGAAINCRLDGREVCAEAARRGLLVREYREAVGLGPSLTVTEAEIAELTTLLEQSILAVSP